MANKLVKSSNENGFTLIELMIVVAIIGMLGSMGVSFYSSFAIKARDTVRRSDLAAYAEMIKSENTASGHVPKTVTYGENSTGDWDTSADDINGNGIFFMDFLGPNQPLDPKPQGDIASFSVDAYGYAFYCYNEPEYLAWWNHQGTSPYAVVFCRLEETKNVYFVRVDDVNCL